MTSQATSSRQRRLLVISYHHPPDGSIGGMRWAGLTKYLAQEGWKSWVVTAAPFSDRVHSNGATVVSCPRRTTLNDRYRALRLRFFRSNPASKPGSVADAPPADRGGAWDQLRLEAGMLLSLPDEARGWILRAAARARRLIAGLQPDAIVSTGPPHSAHVVAWLATRGFRARWLVDLRDPWGGPVADAWRASAQYRSVLARVLTRQLERLVLRSSSGVLCNTQEFAAALASRYPEQTVHWIPNAVDRDLLPTTDARPFPGFGVAYVGTVYGGRDLRPLLRALRVLLDRHLETDRASCHLRVAGHIEENHLEAIDRELDGLQLRDHVAILGVLSREAALVLLARSRLGVVLAQKQDLQVPAKLYELIGMGIPTVVIAPSESAASAEARRIGVTAVDPDDVTALAQLMDDVWGGRVRRNGTPGALIDYSHLAPRVSQLLADRA